MSDTRQIKRGQIYFADLGPVVGSEQGGQRPVIIIQNDVGNMHSPSTIIVPMTSSRSKHNLPTHVVIEGCSLHTKSIALLEQIKTIDKCRLQNYIGKLDEKTLERLNKALKISVGL